MKIYDREQVYGAQQKSVEKGLKIRKEQQLSPRTIDE